MLRILITTYFCPATFNTIQEKIILTVGTTIINIPPITKFPIEILQEIQNCKSWKTGNWEKICKNVSKRVKA